MLLLIKLSFLQYKFNSCKTVFLNFERSEQYFKDCFLACFELSYDATINRHFVVISKKIL